MYTDRGYRLVQVNECMVYFHMGNLRAKISSIRWMDNAVIKGRTSFVRAFYNYFISLFINSIALTVLHRTAFDSFTVRPACNATHGIARHFRLSVCLSVCLCIVIK